MFHFLAHWHWPEWSMWGPYGSGLIYQERQCLKCGRKYTRSY